MKAPRSILTKLDAFDIALNVLNDTAGPSGLFPSLLVFGVMPRIQVKPVDLSAQTERMIDLDVARQKLAKIQTEGIVSRESRRNTPAASMAEIRIKDDVLTYREHLNQ